MINKCPCCNNVPVEAGMISCQKIDCLNYDDKYFIWEWQSLDKSIVELTRLEEDYILNG